MKNIENEYKTDCILFTGYKPCKYKRKNCTGCQHYKPYGTKILIINFGALGSILMTTTLLPAIKRKFPDSTIFWLTEKASLPLLNNNPYLFKVLEFNLENFLYLNSIEFDYIFNIDKSNLSGSIIKQLKSKNKLGFGLSDNGTIIPLNKEAEYLYRTGLDDELKFKKNKKTLPQMLAESFGLEYKKDEYVLNLDEKQKKFVQLYKIENNITPDDIIVGFNTGSSRLFPNKKLRIDHIIYLMEKIHKDFPEVKIALFGGRDETERNRIIEESVGFEIINTPTDKGLYYGIAVMDIADIVVSGDTLGMHIGIGLKKEVVVWFNVSCASEIELYGRGEKIISKVECSPCWKPVCDKGLICLDNIDLDAIYQAIVRRINIVKKRKSK